MAAGAEIVNTDCRQGGRLFISYTGLLEPLGASQVLPYVRGLARRGHRMYLLTFEKKSATQWDRRRLAIKLQDDGIHWSARRYHRRPAILSTVLDVVIGVLWSFVVIVRHDIEMLHARSHVAALVAEIVRRLIGKPYIFDHRGLMAEEFADSGIWKRGGICYRLTAACERMFVKNAAGVVVLTEALAETYRGTIRHLEVIPCAVDLDVFRPASPSEKRPFDLVYAGSWSGIYLCEETRRFFEAYKRIHIEGRMLVVTTEARLFDNPPQHGVEFRAARPEEVPELLRMARAGISLRRQGRAQTAASPVKISEYLATGLPVVSTSGVGDLDSLIESKRIGVVVRSLSIEDLTSAAASLTNLLKDKHVVERCRRQAEVRFSLSAAIERYNCIYEKATCGV